MILLVEFDHCEEYLEFKEESIQRSYIYEEQEKVYEECVELFVNYMKILEEEEHKD